MRNTNQAMHLLTDDAPATDSDAPVVKAFSELLAEAGAWLQAGETSLYRARRFHARAKRLAHRMGTTHAALVDDIFECVDPS